MIYDSADYEVFYEYDYKQTCIYSFLEATRHFYIFIIGKYPGISIIIIDIMHIEMDKKEIMLQKKLRKDNKNIKAKTESTHNFISLKYLETEEKIV
jgi:hypothetical protein